MDYEELKKEFVFEDDKYKLTFWIGPYADEPESIECLAGYDDAELLHNCLTCGRNYYDKVKETCGCSVAYELIGIKDVIALRDGVRAFREKKIDHFGPYPDTGLFDDGWSYFKLELHRTESTALCVATVFQPYGTVEASRPLATEELLKRLEKYFAGIVEKYPIRPFDGAVRKIAGSGEKLKLN